MLEEVLDGLRKIVTGLENGIAAVATAAPLLIHQQIATKAHQKLDSTYDEYMNSIAEEFEANGVLVIKINEKDWLANSLEQGVDQFDMKTRLKTSQKVKVSKKGNLYMSVPIPQNKTGRDAKTDKGAELQAKIRAALSSPKFATPKVTVRKDGTISVLEKVITSDPAASGLYRSRRYGSSDEFRNGVQPKSSTFVLFRTMSNAPGSAQWIHPGIKGAFIFPSVQSWVDSTLPSILTSIIDKAVSDAMKG